MLKAISGHTSTRGIRRYLTKEGRALAEDYINLEPSVPGRPFDWAEAMDRTRRLYGNDSAWRGRRARTYKHYVVSPDPKDRVSLDGLRALATGWARECFPDHEVAIVYHDDNAGGIPHAHVVANNTNLETGRRLQDPDPKALARSLQGVAESLGMSPLEAVPRSGVAARAERRHPRPAARTRREEYVGRAEKELSDRGEYSWVADIRARVRVTRSVARSETEFRSLLGSLGVTVVGELPPRAEARLGVRVRRPAVTQGGRRAAGAVLQPGEAGARPTGRRNPQDSGRWGESDSRSRPKRRRAGEPRGAQDPIRGRGARRIVEGDMRRRPRPPGGGRPKRRARGLRAAHQDPPREAPRAPARRRTFEARAEKGGGRP